MYLSNNEKKIVHLHNKHEGQRCVIIGNGPSLKEMNLNLLKDEITFGVNAIFYAFDWIDFFPTYYVVEDRLVAEDNKKVINNLEGMTKIFPEDLRYCLQGDSETIFINFDRYYSDYPSPDFPKFGLDALNKLYWGGTVTYLNLQLAYYMGFEEVYLIGMDMNYQIPSYADRNVITSKNADLNHFHPEYFGPGKRWHQPKVERMFATLRFANEIYLSDDRKIFNATDGGKLELYPRVNYERVFG